MKFDIPKDWIERKAKEEAACPSVQAGAEPKEIVIFIENDEDGMGNLAHCRKTAHQNLDAVLDELADGEKATLTYERRDMTKAEIEALPEI